MNRLTLIAILAAGCVPGLGHIEKAAAAPCATSGVLTSVRGKILVDRGYGFETGATGLSVKPGDKVSVVGAGNAVVDFGNSKLVTISSSTTETLRVPGCVPTSTSNSSTSNADLVAAIAAGGLATAIALANNRKSNSVRPISP